MPAWLRVMGAVGTPLFNWKVVALIPCVRIASLG